MDTINKVKSISIWIFIVPFLAINTCLILITNFHELFPNKEHVIHNTIPYIEGNKNLKCPCEECITNTSNTPSNISYIKYDEENMKYLYLCRYCGQKWKNN